MEFALSEDQRMLQASVKAFLESASDLEAVRRAAEGQADVVAALAQGLQDLGAGQILVPEAYGGLGLGLLDAALVQEMLGHFAAPADLMASAAMAVTGLLTAGTQAQKDEWLPKIASGEVRFGVAVTERVGAREGAGIEAQGDRLTGKSLFALETFGATHFLIADTSGRLHIVQADGAGVARTALPTIDKTRLFSELRLEEARGIALMGENDPGRAADEMVAVARIMLAADTLGAAQAMLDKAVAYALERKQFGRVIGSFQSVKHLCSEMAAELEPARALLWHAAHARDAGLDEVEVLTCLARAHLAEVGTHVARTSVEVHGGMGFTDLLGLHYWFKRIGANRQLLGGPEQVRLEAAKLQGWA